MSQIWPMTHIWGTLFGFLQDTVNDQRFQIGQPSGEWLQQQIDRDGLRCGNVQSEFAQIRGEDKLVSPNLIGGHMKTQMENAKVGRQHEKTLIVIASELVESEDFELSKCVTHASNILEEAVETSSVYQ